MVGLNTIDKNYVINSCPKTLFNHCAAKLQGFHFVFYNCSNMASISHTKNIHEVVNVIIDCVKFGFNYDLTMYKY